MKKELGIFTLLIVLCAYASIRNPLFYSSYNLINVTQLIGINGIFSIGMGIIIITGGIDLSVGSLFALQAVLLAMAITTNHWPWPVAAAAIIALSVAIGLMHGCIIAKLRLQPFIVTLCGLMVYRGVVREFVHDAAQGYNSESSGMLWTIATGRLTAFVVFLVLAAIMWIVLHRSVYGRYLFAVGRNEEAARYSGINSKLVIASAYGLSGLLAGIAGIFFAYYAQSISPAQHGTAYELWGIAAVVLGGCSLRGGEGSILGIAIGTAVIQVLQNMMNLLGVRSERNYTVVGVVLFLGVLVDQLLAERRKANAARNRIPVEPAAGQPGPPAA